VRSCLLEDMLNTAACSTCYGSRTRVAHFPRTRSKKKTRTWERVLRLHLMKRL